MNSYLYTTNPCEDWFQTMRDAWITSCKPNFSFGYLRKKAYRPHQFPPHGEPFWMYTYYSESFVNKSCPEYAELAKKIQFRVRVIEWAHTPKLGADFPCPFAEQSHVYVVEPPESSRVVTWFKCDQIEELRKSQEEFLSLNDFEVDISTSGNVGLALNASIPIVRRLSPMFVMQSTSYQIHDG